MIAMMTPPWTTNPTREPSGTVRIVSVNASLQRILKSATLSPVWDGRQAHRVDPRLIGGVARKLVGGLPLKAAKVRLNQAVHDGIVHLRKKNVRRLPRAQHGADKKPID